MRFVSVEAKIGDDAARTFRLAGDTNVAPVQDQPVMCAVQVMLWRDPHELGFDGVRCFAVSKASAIGDTKDVGIDGDGAFAKNFHQHDIRSFAANAGEGLKRLAFARHRAVVLIDQVLRKRDDVLGLVTPKADGLNVFADLFFSERDHFLWRVGNLEQIRGRAIYALVGRLR